MWTHTVRILLVDPDPASRGRLDNLLRQVGRFAFQLDWLDSYEAAMAALAGCRHDVHLIAAHLGGKTGLDLLQAGVGAGCQVPCIILAGQDDRDQDLAAMRAGAADYLITSELTPSLLERSIRYAMANKRSEAALLQGEERLAQAQRIAHLGNWDWQIETGEMFWSDEIYRIFGFAPRAVNPSYETFLGLVHPQDKPLVNLAVNEALYAGKPFQLEHRLVLADGAERFVAEQGEVTFGTDRTPVRMIGTVQDITSRRRAEESLRLLEEKFAKAFRNSPDWIVITRAVDGRYIEVNDAMLRLTGYQRDEVIGRTSVELGVWVEPQERTGMLKQLDEQGGVRNLEVRFRMKSGEHRTMLWSAELMDYRGDACLIVVAHDVTEMRQLENDLLKSQAKLYQKHAELQKYLARVESARQEWEWTLNCIDQMVILGDRDGRIKRSNRAFQEFTGLSTEQLVGLDWAELLHAYELTTGTIFLKSMELFHQPSGRWFSLSPHQFREGDEGEVAGTVITIHDITELKQMSEQLQQYRERG